MGILDIINPKPQPIRLAREKPSDNCSDCGDPLYLQVLQSAAGFYLGSHCKCGPYSRESGYFPSIDEAVAAWLADPQLLAKAKRI